MTRELSGASRLSFRRRERNTLELFAAGGGEARYLAMTKKVRSINAALSTQAPSHRGHPNP